MIPLLHLAATWYMTGLIWVIQVVHYPMLGLTGQNFDRCQRFHLSRMTGIVAPAMLLELATGFWLLRLHSGEPIWWVASALLAGIWVSTFLVQVPRHERLDRDGFQPRVHAELVNSNWIRTVFWSIRAVLVTCAIQFL